MKFSLSLPMSQVPCRKVKNVLSISQNHSAGKFYYAAFKEDEIEDWRG